MRTLKPIISLLLVLTLLFSFTAFADSAEGTVTADLEARFGVTTASIADKYTRTLTKGTNGNDVKALQSTLISLGYLDDTADGSFGGKTKAAVELFEQEQDLVQDGAIEPIELYYLLEGDPLTRDEVVISKANANNPDSVIAAINVLPVRVSSASVLVQSKLNKETYPDMMTAVVENTTAMDITGYTIGFLAFDVDGQPIEILTQYDENGYYEILGDAADITLAAGKTFGGSYGWRLQDNHGITYLLACVQSATKADGTVWENPIYSVWKDCFCQKTLPDSVK